MPYRIIRDPAGRPRILLDGEPPYCHALRAAPPERERELDTGRWLVMAFPAWSAPDIAAIETALETVKRFGGDLELGLRPYDDPEELATWCPGVEDTGSSPLWVVFRNGKVCLQRQGLPSAQDLFDAIDVIDAIERPVQRPPF